MLLLTLCLLNELITSLPGERERTAIQFPEFLQGRRSSCSSLACSNRSRECHSKSMTQLTEQPALSLSLTHTHTTHTHTHLHTHTLHTHTLHTHTHTHTHSATHPILVRQDRESVVEVESVAIGS